MHGETVKFTEISTSGFNILLFSCCLGGGVLPPQLASFEQE